MGVFSDREFIGNKVDTFAIAFRMKYKDLADQKCPSLISKLPFFRQGVDTCLAYGSKPFFIFSKDAKQPPFSFLTLGAMLGTWDESEYQQLREADSIDDIVEILELGEVLYCKALDSLEPAYLNEALTEKVAGDLAGQLLEEHIRTLQPTLEDAAERMGQVQKGNEEVGDTSEEKVVIIHKVARVSG